MTGEHHEELSGLVPRLDAGGAEVDDEGGVGSGGHGFGVGDGYGVFGEGDRLISLKFDRLSGAGREGESDGQPYRCASHTPVDVQFTGRG
jgi:hypothetical protein